MVLCAIEVFKSFSFRSELRAQMVVFTSCVNFRNAAGECVRVGSSSIPGSSAEGMDPKYVETNTAQRTNS